VPLLRRSRANQQGQAEALRDMCGDVDGRSDMFSSSEIAPTNAVLHRSAL
jgi:hypothetical protein